MEIALIQARGTENILQIMRQQDLRNSSKTRSDARMDALKLADEKTNIKALRGIDIYKYTTSVDIVRR